MIKRRLKESDEQQNEESLYNSVDIDNRVIYLYDSVDEKAGLMIAKAMDKFRGEEPGKDVLIKINSTGGMIDVLIGIIAEIKEKTNEFKVHADITGLAYSAAAYISLFCDSVTMFKHSTYMFHYPIWSECNSDLMDHERSCIQLKKQWEPFIVDGLKNTKVSYTMYKKWLEEDKEKYFNAQECLDYGFIDEIYG